MRRSATRPSSTSSLAATMWAGSFLPASPTRSTRSSSPGTTLNPFSSASERSSGEILSAPPSSNQCTMSSTFAPPTRASNVSPAARWIRSLAIVSAPCSSPSYSSSSLPVIAGSAAYTSDTRGTTAFSLVAIARRSALETTFSSTLIGSRCDTPLFLSTRLSLRALERDPLHQLRDEVRHPDRAAVARQPRLLPGDRRAQLDGVGVVRHDLRADAVLERRDDLAARRVVLGIRREHQRHVQVQPHRIAFELDVAFLHDVEQAHLDLPREVGQLVDREDAAVGARQQAEVHRQLVGQQVPAARRLDRVHVADDVGDRHVGRRELLDVARVARQPRDRRAIARAPPPAPGRTSRSVRTDRRSPRCRRGSGSPRPAGSTSSRRMRLFA